MKVIEREINGGIFMFKPTLKPQPGNQAWRNPKYRYVCIKYVSGDGKIEMNDPFTNKAGPIRFKSIAKAVSHIQNVGV